MTVESKINKYIHSLIQNTYINFKNLTCFLMYGICILYSKNNIKVVDVRWWVNGSMWLQGFKILPEIIIS